MVSRKVTDRPKDVVARNIVLVKQVTRYLLDHPDVLGSLPEGFEMVILPEDDPEMRSYNLELLDTYGSEGRPVVFVRTHPGETSQSQMPPRIYVPVAA